MGSKQEQDEREGTVMTTLGVIAKSHIKAIEEEYLAYSNKIKSIHDYLRRTDLPYQRNEGVLKNFMMVVMTPLCNNDNLKGLVAPAEIGLVVFSLGAGVVEAFSYLVDTGEIPFGERGGIINVCEEFALPLPGTYKERGVAAAPASKILEDMQTLVNKYGLIMDKEMLMFVGRQDVCIVTSCMNWLIAQAPERKAKFKVFSLEILVMELSRLSYRPEINPAVIQHEGGSAKFIYHTRYDFLPSLACEWHQKKEHARGLNLCARTVALKRIYNSLFYLCHLFGKDMEPAKHKPTLPTADITDKRLELSMQDWMDRNMAPPPPGRSFIFTQTEIDNVIFYDGKEISENDEGFEPAESDLDRSDYNDSSTDAYVGSSPSN